MFINKKHISGDTTNLNVKSWFSKKKAKDLLSVQELKDWAISFLFAAVVYFILLPAVLGTSSPGIVVGSCSEQGYLNIGDILILQGMKIAEVNAPAVEVSQYRGFIPIFENGKVMKINISGTIIARNASNDIVVYRANPSGVQIIHRALAKVKVGNNLFLLTMGDANPIPDQMAPQGGQCIDENIGCISTPVTQRQLVGRQAIFPLPLLGHLKLFFCDLTFGKVCDGHANVGTGYEYKLWC